MRIDWIIFAFRRAVNILGPAALVLAGLVACVSPSPKAAIELPPEVANAPIIVLGEIHGTRESPLMAANTVEALAARGRPVALGLEVPSAMSPWLDSYADSDGKGEARASLLSSPHWTRPRRYQDGRGSLAMAELIERMRALRASGRRVRVFGFVPPDIRDPHLYEKGMADEILARRRDGETIVALVGNVHAMKHAAESRFAKQPKMASFLPPSTVSLVMRNRGGSQWTCVPECGVTEAGMAFYSDAALDGQVVMKRGEGYDGIVYVGKITASEPAAARD